jgi:mannose-1-phosphate guanylyltransferase / mannose-6-phosphate isomerase
MSFETRIWPVLLSGGSGTRLWPLSRTLYPKQLLPLAQRETMLEATALRAADQRRFHPAIVVAGEDHRFLVKAQLDGQKQPADTILLEPQPRNTAPAIALAALLLGARDPDSIMLVMPSDHVIQNVDAFQAAIAEALPSVQAGALATFGITPDKPETGYGYIETSGSNAARPVVRFVEKPDLPTAEAYVAGGRHFWNSGIFLFRASAYLKALEAHAPDVLAACTQAMTAAARDGQFLRPEKIAFAACPSISIDYAVMEKAPNVIAVPVDMGWSDVGSWDALWTIGDKDSAGNSSLGDTILIDSQDNLVRVEGGPAVATVGVSDMIIVSTADAVLVAPRDRAQDVKKVVDVLKASGRDEGHAPAVVHRPWGTYQTTDSGERFQTKRIVVNPGAQLSLQLHHHRSEHWIVVSGSARVTVGDDVIMLQENQSTYISAGTKHRLENPGKIPLHLIEVQCGPYLGEDDIVRFEDSYGRVA